MANASKFLTKKLKDSFKDNTSKVESEETKKEEVQTSFISIDDMDLFSDLDLFLPDDDDEKKDSDKEDVVEDVVEDNVEEVEDTPVVEDVPETDSEPVVEDVPEEADEVENNEEEETEEVETVEEPPVVETEPETEPVKEDEVEEEPKVKEPEVKKTTTKSKKGTKSRTKKKVVKEDCAPESDEDSEAVEVPEAEMSLEGAFEFMNKEMIPTIESWKAEKASVNRRMDEILFDPDMTVDDLREKMANLSYIKNDIHRLWEEAKSAEYFVRKKVERVETLYGTGSNATERKRNAIIACSNYREHPNDKSVNLYDLDFLVKDRYNFYDSKLTYVKDQMNGTITQLGLLKADMNVNSLQY